MVSHMKKMIYACKKVCPWVLFFTVYMIDIIFIILKGRASLDSDMASEMILADMLNREGGLVSNNWYYSTELHIFTQQPFLQLGLLLFPKDWNIARAVGMAIMLGLVAGAYLFFAYAMHEKISRGACFAAAVICPIGFWYMNLVTFGGYYLPYLILILSGAALILLFCHEGEATPLRRSCWFVLLNLVAFCGGLSGVRYLINFYVPLAVAALLILAYRIHKEPHKLLEFKCQEWQLCIAVVSASISNFIAYVINIKILAQKYSFENMTNQSWGEMSIARLLDVWSDFLGLFGFQNDGFANSLSMNQTSPKLFSVQGMISILGIGLAFAILASSVRLLQRWKSLTFQQQVLVLLFWCILLIDGMIFAWTDGFESNVTYWVPAVPFAFMLLEVECTTEHFSISQTREVLITGFAVCVLCTGYATIREYQTEPLRANSRLDNIGEWLVENEYTEGYATFWYSNVLTALSNGQLELWTVYNLDDRAVHGWLQKKEHQTPPKSERIFVMIGPSDEITASDLSYDDLGQSEIVYSDEEGFSIVAFEQLHGKENEE